MSNLTYRQSFQNCLPENQGIRAKRQISIFAMFRLMIFFILVPINIPKDRKLLEVEDLKNIVCLFVNEPICGFQDGVKIGGRGGLKLGFFDGINTFP